MILPLIFAAAIVGMTPTTHDANQIMTNLKSTAASCFKIGWTLRDMKDNPNLYVRGAYERSLERSNQVCFTQVGK
jgi:hypothetical protein